MADLLIKRVCSKCHGAKLMPNPEGGPDITCDSCGLSECYAEQKIDVTAIMTELNYIHGKVTAIWNQVKPPA